LKEGEKRWLGGFPLTFSQELEAATLYWWLFINNMKNIKIILSTALLTVFVILGTVYVFKNPDNVFAGLPGSLVNIVGSRPATTTVSAIFSGNGQSGTSTQVLNLRGFADQMVTTFLITDASSTPEGLLTYQFLASNDKQCESTLTSTTADDQALASEINWYALGTEGQISATAGVATGTVVSLQNLVWQCVKVEINGSSTEALVQTRTKDDL